jgi:hypothetical protein
MYKRFRQMQEKMQNISPIKQRILQFIDEFCKSKRVFYTLSGISRGTLESETGITEDTLAKVFAAYPNLSPTWVITGVGGMFLDQDNKPDQKPQHPPDSIRFSISEPGVPYGKDLPPGPCGQCTLRERLLAAKEETIVSLRSRIASLEKLLNK